MIAIKVNNDFLDLKDGFTIRMNFINSMFDENIVQGSYSYPATLPPTKKNKRILEFPHLLTNAVDFKKSYPCTIINRGINYIPGTLNILKVSPDNIQVNINTGVSQLAQLLTDKKLRDFDLGSFDYFKPNTGYMFAGIDGTPTENIKLPLTIYDRNTNITVNKFFEQPFVNNLHETLLLLAAQINNTYQPQYTAVEFSIRAKVYGMAIIVWSEEIYSVQGGEFVVYEDFYFTDICPNYETGNGALWNVFSRKAGLGYISHTEDIKYHIQGLMIETAKFAQYNTTSPHYSPRYDYEKFIYFPIKNNDFQSENNYVGYVNYMRDVFTIPLNEMDPWNVNTSDKYKLSPQLYIFYVIEKILNINGLKVYDTPFWLDPEYRNLILYNNQTIDFKYADYADVYKFTVFLKDHLPDITVGNFLNQFRKFFGLHIDFKPNTNQVGFVKVKDILNNTKYVDWTDKVVDFYDSYEIKEIDGYSLKFELPNNDSLVSERNKSITGKLVKQPVQEFPDLPNSAELNEVRLVLLENIYYEAVFDNAGTLTWQYHSHNYHPIVIGNGKKVNTISVYPIYTDVDSNSVHTGINWLLPHIEQEGYQPTFGRGEITTDFRLLFYRGLQKNSQDNYYPFASAERYNYDKELVGNYSLKWDGPDGVYEKLHKEFVSFLTKTKLVKCRVYLRESDFQELDMTVRVKILNNFFYIRKLEPVFPINSLTPVELYKI